VLSVEQAQVAVTRPGTPGVALAWRPTRESSAGERYLLGVDDAGHARFAVHDAALVDQQPHAGIRELAAVLDPTEASLAVHAIALDNWHAAHQFCPRCGSRTDPAAAGSERRCVFDGSVHFPRTDPAVIVLVTDPDDRALLGRQAEWPKGRFSTLAGFVEPGESAEQAVAREVGEESGVLASEIRYDGTQPWPFPSSLMLGLFARAGHCEPKPDGFELEQVRWFSRADLAAGIADGSVAAPTSVSISRRLIERWYGSALPQGPPGSEWR
jgi:NAD+ diphosphatase